MAKFMKKGSFGVMVDAPGGASDPELAEVRFTAAEYNELWGRINTAERNAARAEADAARREDKAYKEADLQLIACRDKTQAEADRRVEAAEIAKKRAEDREAKAVAEKEAVKNALERQKNLNKNLKRIARERANAERGLTPKKERSGYIVIYSQQYNQKYRVDHDSADKKEFAKYEVLTAKCWQTILQTPYDSSLPLNQVQDDIWDELDFHLYNMGFRKIQEKDKNGVFRTWYDVLDDGRKHEVCGLYKWDFKANYKSGLWEITLYHTKSLKVPEEYRPVRKR